MESSKDTKEEEAPVEQVESTEEEKKQPKIDPEMQKEQMLKILEQLGSQGGNKQFKELKALYEKHEFWDTQPVPKAHEVITVSDSFNRIDSRPS